MASVAQAAPQWAPSLGAKEENETQSSESLPFSSAELTVTGLSILLYFT